ncbi:uncharacterized protein N7473_003219 [Penicillium subrubescens]|uniref:Uncharacterized protein n=1 Tax=Penicillium subrubescens TaxID=1316194 RepID=A0A1Q5UAE1_9EURO|nr:uncharacterized protein N7473_003219 [Penicillium subrubescens]KAJ5906303.1 hypothetical protein N7473_003219 [Penicillium subrubescens]OKP09437.1 hypothetical protein PENSUB_5259 [Penicillium subrubescens]
MQNRLASVITVYKTAREHNGNFILLRHGLWELDGRQNSTAPYPGDNGDWTLWDSYLTQLCSDIKRLGMTEGWVIDIWNEPELVNFWPTGK